MGAFLRKYAVASAAGSHVGIPMIKAGVNDFAVSADWTPAVGDCKLSIDGAAQANITTLPAYTNGQWVFQFTAAELTGKSIRVAVVDSATKAVEDQFFVIETYGNASALHPFDFGTASTAQTGDSFARIGAPVGASISADLSGISSQVNTVDDLLDTEMPAMTVAVAAIKAKTDNLPAAPAAVGDLSTLATATAVAGVLTEVQKVPRTGTTHTHTNTGTAAAATVAIT